MSVSVIVDGNMAVVEPSEDVLAETARKLLAAADHPWDVQPSIGRRLGFRVPAALVDSLGLIEAEEEPDDEEGDDDAQEPNSGDAEKPETTPDPPTGNASRAVWAAFLDEQGIAYKDDDGRDDLRELWANRS